MENMLLFLLLLIYTPTRGQKWGTNDFFHHHQSWAEYEINGIKYAARVTECGDGRPSICKVKVSKNEATLLEITKNENYIRFKRDCPPAECDNDQVRFVLHPAQSCPVCLGSNYYTQQICSTMADCASLATACLNGVCRFAMNSNLEAPFSCRPYCEHRSDCPTFYHCFKNECVDDKSSAYHIENMFCTPPRWACPTNFDCHPEFRACFAQKSCSSDGECDEDQRCDPYIKICVPASVNSLQTSNQHSIPVLSSSSADQRPAVGVIAAGGKKKCSCKKCSRVCKPAG